MKYFVFIASTLMSSLSFSMEDIHQLMLNGIARKSEKLPSITVINNTQFQLAIKIGDIEKDHITSTLPLRKDKKVTFSPYSSSFCIEQCTMHKGITIPLTLDVPNIEQKPSYNLLIGSISKIKFGDTVRIDYENDKMNVVHNPDVIQPQKQSMNLIRVSHPGIELNVKRTNKSLKFSNGQKDPILSLKHLVKKVISSICLINLK